jgi:hypothetical protein
MNSPQNKIFYFLEYWPIPFGVLQTCCKIQKCKKIIFVVFKKSMRKHIFETSNIFCIKKMCSKHDRVLAVCNTQENIFLIYMYICHIALKTGYSKYEISIFTIKKTQKNKNKYTCLAPVTVQVN